MVFVLSRENPPSSAMPLPFSGSRGKGHLLIGVAPVVTADVDRHFLIKTLQKIEQLVGGEAAEMPVHQVRHAGLRGAGHSGDLALLQLPALRDLAHATADLRPDQKLAGILGAEIGEDVAGPLPTGSAEGRPQASGRLPESTSNASSRFRPRQPAAAPGA